MALEINHNPDVLLCLANLSNDEVFTPPNIANAMLDLLPEDLWSNPEATFLDPCCKSGVFLREIAKRLIKGLEHKIPNLEKRLEHIYHKQLFGIAITELTALLSRRSLYCSKHANSKWSVTPFDTPEGNIAFPRVDHTWDGNRCIHCGASKEVFGDRKETHAYALIHDINPEELFKMKFDVIIGNPPYQLNDGGGTGSSASPIYHLFVEQAKKLKPRHLVMVIPSRWFAGGKGLDDFRLSMLNDNRLKTIVDYFDSMDCFPGVDISGGICYFHRDKNCKKNTCNVISYRNNNRSELERPLLENSVTSFIRFNEAVQIVRKVFAFNEKRLDSIVSARKPYGYNASIKIRKNKFEGSTKVYAYPQNGYTEIENIKQNIETLDQYKVFIAKAYGERGAFPYLVIGKPFIGEPGTSCTETYLLVGPIENKLYAKNLLTYITTRFFRFLVLLKKNTQNAPRGVYQFVPMQDFSKPWTDEELYAKYGLTAEEIAFIESMVRPMEVNLDE